jgi:hypothetical protein
LGVVYHWIAHWTPAVAVRRVAFLLIAPSGGLGWLLVLLGQSNWLGSLALDWISPEAYVFLLLYTPPHWALAATCLLLGVLWVHQACRRTERDGSLTWRAHLGPALAGGAAFALLAVVGAFYLPVPAAVLGTDWIVNAIRQRRPNWRALALIAVSGIAPSPLAAYTWWLFIRQPVYRTWSAQNQIPSLHPLHYLVGYAVLGALALLGLLVARRRRQTTQTLPLVWLAVTPILLALPFDMPRRLIIGAQVPLGLLAARGLVYGVALPLGRSVLAQRLAVHPRYSRHGLRRLLVAAAIALTLPTPVLLLTGNIGQVLARAPPIYHSRSELAALDWLAAHSTPDKTVLSSFSTGNYLPARAGNRVVLGHGPLTIDSERKTIEVQQFYSAEAAEAWRRELLDRYGVAFVWYGPHERALDREGAEQGCDPGSAPYLRAVYDRDGYAIYEVQREIP